MAGGDIQARQSAESAQIAAQQSQQAIQAALTNALAAMNAASEAALGQLNTAEERIQGQMAALLDIVTNTVGVEPEVDQEGKEKPRNLENDIIDAGLEEFYEDEVIETEDGGGGNLSLLAMRYDTTTHKFEWSSDGGSTYPNEVFEATG